MNAPLDVAIVGAGFAGIGMALALRREGRESFVVLERAESVGGTWRDNTYPGVACDVPSHLYGFADHPNPHWSGVFAPGAGDPERTSTASRTGCATASASTPRCCGRAGTASCGSSMSAARARRPPRGALARARVRAPDRAVGAATSPGSSRSPGPLFHSARWDHAVPVDGARVAVVGTGASAVQLVPELVRRGAAVTLFQRTPAWIVPREGREYADAERLAFADDPAALARVRAGPLRGGRGTLRLALRRRRRRGIRPFDRARAPRVAGRRRRPCGARSRPTTPSDASGCCSPTTSTRRSPPAP